ncbi:MAG: LacI family DNA-binding transcriptional regulator [Spirochaetaceae bacterium]|jgi:LacI family transcriptional regulator|nr:LacI family DNA-binding transcriptional regulator [Spirochaetaceae bacterium]
MARKHLTSNEIAKIAGVSRGTVSKVVNNYGDVGDETRKKILKIIAEAGYAPNIAARRLAGKKTETIGLFFLVQRDESYDLSADSIIDRMITSVVEAAAKLGFLVLTIIIRDGDQHSGKKIREVFHQDRIDAGIFIGCRKSEPIIEDLISRGYIIGQLDYPRPSTMKANNVIINFEPDTGRKAAKYLLDIGHRRILSLHGDPFRYDAENKKKLFDQTIQDAGLRIEEGYSINASFYQGEGEVKMREFLNSGQRLPTAIFCANDHIAYGVLHVLKTHGINVPEDISILGVDDALFSRYLQPALTTFAVDFTKMLHELTHRVIALVNEEKDVELYCEFTTELIERQSCRKIAEL